MLVASGGCAAVVAVALTAQAARSEQQRAVAGSSPQTCESSRRFQNQNSTSLSDHTDAPQSAAKEDKVLSDKLVWACRRGKVGTIHEALSQGVDINARSVAGRTMLSYAAERDDMRPLSIWLLENGADVNAQDSRGFSVVAFAAWKDSVYTLLLLLKHGATPLTHDIYGLSPLHKAAGFVSTCHCAACVALPRQAGSVMMCASVRACAG